MPGFDKTCAEAGILAPTPSTKGRSARWVQGLFFLVWRPIHGDNLYELLFGKNKQPEKDDPENGQNFIGNGYMDEDNMYCYPESLEEIKENDDQSLLIDIQYEKQRGVTMHKGVNENR